MGKQAENKKKKKQLLLESSFELFMKKGWLETTISDIVKQANVAKGTFYLYFKDKYDIRNNLISYKANQLLLSAHHDLIENHAEIVNFKQQFLYIIHYIIEELKNNKSLLKLIAKNLSWAVFKSALITPNEEEGINFWDLFCQMLPENSISEKDAEIMLFQITELVGSTIYNVILYNEPVSIQEFQPYLEHSIQLILNTYLSETK